MNEDGIKKRFEELRRLEAGLRDAKKQQRLYTESAERLTRDVMTIRGSLWETLTKRDLTSSVNAGFSNRLIDFLAELTKP
jgi:hypothetical protein